MDAVDAAWKCGVRLLAPGGREQAVQAGLVGGHPADQARNVEDQCNPTRPEDGEAADALRAVEDGAERADHCLVLAHQVVDDQPGALSGVVHHHDVLALDRLEQEGEFLVDGRQIASGISVAVLLTLFVVILVDGLFAMFYAAIDF